MLDIAPGAALPVATVAAEDRLFIELLDGYRSCGGLQRLATVQATRRHAWDTELIETLPQAVAERRVLGIAWNHELWIPGFQFGRSGAIEPAVTRVFLELRSSHDPWELAGWFIAPSTWLQQRRPVDLIGSAPACVVAAARADRYVATGA